MASPRADRLVSLVEAAITRLDEGDIEGAEQKIAQAARIDPRHPDVLSLQASLAALDGELERALELVAKAVERAPEDVGVLINAADLALLADPEVALGYAQRAAELVEEEDELIAAVLIMAEAHLALENPAAAREALSELSSAVIDDATTILDVAHAYLAAEDPTTAELWLRRLTSAQPSSGNGEDSEDESVAADAWHAIGQCREAKGDRDGMIHAWLETRRLDAALPPPALSISDDELEEIATAALEELPAEVHTHLANVPILVDDLPAEHLVQDGWDPRLLGIFEGTPLPEQSAVGGAPSVTTIHLFKTNLERFVGDDREALAEEIRVTILHETAHYFGLDDDDLAKLGLD
ncbi:MAG: tetratricopeptide repeat protein [Kofleriaceae bacterium]|nr:MAG: tetratricopeptide repeat protein [Kofleriaceae bacterium]MBZ0238711.1 metallopeptidase family protein [Kofleriaceae bacterium]